VSDDSLNVVPVLRGHLVELERALTFVEGMLVAMDLETQYKKMDTLHRPSQLTRSVQAALTRVNGYLDDEEVNDLSPE
jgi:phosphopantetheine adenylyltransferase